LCTLLYAANNGIGECRENALFIGLL
jgi:hypothetical protein